MFSQLLGITFGIMLIGLMLYVLFGQITVRKLRKNTKTRDALGIEFASGWDVLNVAQALALPKSWMQKLKGSPLSSLYADVDVLYEYTSKFDRFLAFVLFWMLTLSVGAGLLLILLDAIGVFD